jgi:hypothetical protein
VDGTNPLLTESFLVAAKRGDLLVPCTNGIIGEPLHFRTARTYLLEWLEGTKGNVDLRTHWKYQQYVHDFLAQLGVKADLDEVYPQITQMWTMVF